MPDLPKRGFGENLTTKIASIKNFKNQIKEDEINMRIVTKYSQKE